MKLSRSLLAPSVALAAGIAPLLLALALPAASRENPAGLDTPQQVADTLDSIVQPRFQLNAGRFGVDRVVHLEGHSPVGWIDPSSHSEAQQFAVVNASHRSYVIAFLHCVHKPGAHVDPRTPAEPLVNGFKPYTSALVALGATQAGAQNDYDWADKVLTPVVLPYLGHLKQGQPAEVEYENWVVVMRPVRALHQACIDCHAGAKRGDTLGVMVYAVDKNAKIKGPGFEAPGGE